MMLGRKFRIPTAQEKQVTILQILTKSTPVDTSMRASGMRVIVDPRIP